MGWVIRHAYFVGETPRPISQRAFNRFYGRGAAGALAEVSNERVRFATYYLVSESRRIVALDREEYSTMLVDGDGKLDQEAFDQQRKDLVHLLDQAESSGPLVDASARFANARHRWTPTQTQRRALMKLWKLPANW